MFARLLMTGLWLTAASPALAADITVDFFQGINFVSVAGTITSNDPPDFERITTGLHNDGSVIVVFNSEGGELYAGLDIGTYIRAHGMMTSVGPNRECASVCALMWLAGTTRFYSPSAHIGFHAAYYSSGPEYGQETGVGNALVGDYLSRLGIPIKTIVFATEKGPTEINWLHAEDLDRLGITATELPDPKPAQEVSNSELSARRLIYSYFETWSKPGISVDDLYFYYSNKVNYYCSSLPVEKVMDEKRRFSQRWPIRTYTIKADTLYVKCGDLCSASAVVEWDVSSLERNAHSVGSANFVLRIDPSQGQGKIVSEDGSVLDSHAETLPNTESPPSPVSIAPVTAEQQSTVSPSYLQGHDDRVNYETWYAALPPGDYHDGASFWAEHRSDKPQPRCEESGPSGAWQEGCNFGRQMLTQSDIRRKTDKNYKLGWNSLP